MNHDHDHDHDCCAAPALPATGPLPNVAGAQWLRLRIDKMDCPTEENLIRSRLGSMAGIVQLDFNLLQRQLSIAHTLSDVAPIHAALHALDMQPTPPPGKGASGTDAAPTRSRGQWWMLGIGAGAALLAEVVAWTLGDEGSWPVIGLALLAIGLSGTGTYRKGWIALRNRNLNINALMTIAVTGALAIGQWPEAAMVMVLFALAEMIEARSLERARHAIHGLMALAPPQATVLQPDGSWRSVDIAAVAPGALARVAPGERVALDGVLTAGQSSVDQAPITGESMPVRENRRRPGVCRQHQPERLVRVPCHRRRQRFDPGAHHPRSRARADQPRADAALRRSLRAGVYAARAAAGSGGGAAGAAGIRHFLERWLPIRRWCCW